MKLLAKRRNKLIIIKEDQVGRAPHGATRRGQRTAGEGIMISSVCVCARVLVLCINRLWDRNMICMQGNRMLSPRQKLHRNRHQSSLIMRRATGEGVVTLFVYIG